MATIRNQVPLVVPLVAKFSLLRTSSQLGDPSMNQPTLEKQQKASAMVKISLWSFLYWGIHILYVKYHIIV